MLTSPRCLFNRSSRAPACARTPRRCSRHAPPPRAPPARPATHQGRESEPETRHGTAQVFPIKGDGRCMFRSISRSLAHAEASAAPRRDAALLLLLLLLLLRRDADSAVPWVRAASSTSGWRPRTPMRCANRHGRCVVRGLLRPPPGCRRGCRGASSAARA